MVRVEFNVVFPDREITIGIDTIELIVNGLKSELLLVPQEKLNAVLAALADDASASNEQSPSTKEKSKPLNEDPWQGLLGEDS